jgi:hypothetical protein
MKLKFRQFYLFNLSRHRRKLYLRRLKYRQGRAKGKWFPSEVRGKGGI